MMEVMWQYEFMRHALLAGVIVGLISPLVGVFLVVRRLSLIADALSHVTLSGVAAGLLLQREISWLQSFNPLYMGTAFSVAGALFVEQLRRLYRSYQELAIPIILSGGIGLGVVLISAGEGFNVNVMGYLFGSIIAVNDNDVKWVVVVGIIVALTIALLYKELFALSFDEESAYLSGIPRRGINLVFILLVALVITASVRVVGILLVSALMTLPVAASLQLAQSFRQTVMLSVLFAETSVISGLICSFYFDLAPGGTIVLIAVGWLLLTILLKRLQQISRYRWMKREQEAE
ncbi:zinc ABC transporter permease [Polycladomyces abyssicola]|uniref:Zinc ABC transporter permease n=1 Tax=Polycladomyces abyssicola TaxID=1125966 RepID=A0A8D5UBU8_9BACL|nr:metal ABC transporter permease [Polycladomyces abyssicola]BCU80240.1 zinc ABC transporter permease [Polycladomyces abyssicola]